MFEKSVAGPSIWEKFELEFQSSNLQAQYTVRVSKHHCGQTFGGADVQAIFGLHPVSSSTDNMDLGEEEARLLLLPAAAAGPCCWVSQLFRVTLNPVGFGQPLNTVGFGQPRMPLVSWDNRLARDSASTAHTSASICEQTSWSSARPCHTEYPAFLAY